VLGNPENDYNEYHLEIADEIADIYAVVLKKFMD